MLQKDVDNYQSYNEVIYCIKDSYKAVQKNSERQQNKIGVMLKYLTKVNLILLTQKEWI